MNEINSFPEFQNDLQVFVTNYIDNNQKAKFFVINKKMYSKMLYCFDNVRQMTEKIEECVKKEEVEKNMFTKELSDIYRNNLVNKNLKLESFGKMCR